eukprot:Gregarina_sp_Poly_1__8353@NODE_489_length_7968_cov_116_830528_g394_i0_p7_GENE_NODE_489_length_7968_cov_116_830528_g394_i0NODE_489_length_7968_cov_116_830528_g394_i0_p7_ORF_typecomplete_len109_score8_61_NODE_489_length_7968_cov_116_830528_g394_i074407766
MVVDCQKLVPSSCHIEVLWNMTTSNCHTAAATLIGTGGDLVFEGYTLNASELLVAWETMTTENIKCTKLGYGATVGADFEACSEGTPKRKKTIERKFASSHLLLTELL